MVEHSLGKGEVESSILSASSRFKAFSLSLLAVRFTIATANAFRRAIEEPELTANK